jgi:hypothetical protein
MGALPVAEDEHQQKHGDADSYCVKRRCAEPLSETVTAPRRLRP